MMKKLLIITFLFCTSLLKSQTIPQTCATYFDSIFNREIYVTVDSMPQFPGGIDSMIVFIQNNLLWPYVDYDFEGSVYISFIVEADGSITKKRVLRGIEESVDLEALKVIDKMPMWKPAECNGQAVPFRMIVPVKFKLN